MSMFPTRDNDVFPDDKPGLYVVKKSEGWYVVEVLPEGGPCKIDTINEHPIKWYKQADSLAFRYYARCVGSSAYFKDCDPLLVLQTITAPGHTSPIFREEFILGMKQWKYFMTEFVL